LIFRHTWSILVKITVKIQNSFLKNQIFLIRDVIDTNQISYKIKKLPEPKLWENPVKPTKQDF